MTDEDPPMVATVRQIVEDLGGLRQVWRLFAN